MCNLCFNLAAYVGNRKTQREEEDRYYWRHAPAQLTVSVAASRIAKMGAWAMMLAAFLR